MAFSIRLLPDTICGPDGQRLGEIHVEGFVERFAVYPILGMVEDVAVTWPIALRSLVSGSDAVGLAVASNMGWLFYRFGNKVLVQQSLFVQGWGGELNMTGNVTRVPAHQRVLDDGEQISEWSTTIHAIRVFLAT